MSQKLDAEERNLSKFGIKQGNININMDKKRVNTVSNI